MRVLTILAILLTTSAVRAQSRATETRPEPAPRPAAERVLGELGLGLALPALFGGAGALLGWQAASCPPGVPECEAAYAIAGLGVGVAAGALALPAAVTLGGRLGGGRGNAGGAYLGALAGAGVSMLFVVPFALYAEGVPEDPRALVCVGVGAALELLGAIVGYELVHERAVPAVEASVTASASGARLEATLRF